NGRYSSATALSILAIEELGKHFILNGLVSLSPGDKTSSVWKKYRNHLHKNQMWVLPSLAQREGKSVSNLIFKTIFQDSDHPDFLDWLKQASLYTDCVGNRE